MTHELVASVGRPVLATAFKAPASGTRKQGIEKHRSREKGHV